MVGNILIKLSSKSYIYTYLGAFFPLRSLIVSILRFCKFLSLSAALRFFIVSGLLLFSLIDAKRRFTMRLSVRTVLMWSTQYFDGSSHSRKASATILCTMLCDCLPFLESVQPKYPYLSLDNFIGLPLSVLYATETPFLFGCNTVLVTDLILPMLLTSYKPSYPTTGFQISSSIKLKSAPSVQMWYEHILLTRSNKSLTISISYIP